MSFVKMDWGRGAASDSEEDVKKLPFFPPILEHKSENDDSYSKMRTPCPSSIEKMDDDTLDIEIKEEVGELFTGRSIDEGNDETVFPSGLILIHDQPTATMTVTDSWTETHLISYTPLFMGGNGSPSYLQTSTPNTSIIPTNNSDIQFLRPEIEAKPARGTKFSKSLHPPPQDPLEITPRGRVSSSSESRLPVQPQITMTPNPPEGSKFEGVEGETREERKRRLSSLRKKRSRERRRQTEILRNSFAPQDPLGISTEKGKHEVQNATIAKHFACTLCGMKYCTLVERNEHVLGVHDHSLCSHAKKPCKFLCHVNISIPTEEHIIDVQEKKCRSTKISMIFRPPMKIASQDRQEIASLRRISTESIDSMGETRKERKRRQTVEAARRKRKTETPEERTARLAVRAKIRRKWVANQSEEKRKEKLAASAERLRNRLANETEEQRLARLAASAERRKNYSLNMTPEQRNARLAANAARNMKRFGGETPEQRIARLAAVVQCEYCEKSLAPNSLRPHVIREHSKTEDKKFKCDHCQKTFAMQGDCKRHMLTHSKEKRFICDKCGKGYQNKAGMETHIILKHGFANEIPDQRSERFTFAADFVRCEYCEKSLALRSLRYHMIREHSQEEDKKFKCDLCEKTFAMEGDYKIHMLTHSTGKRFICDKCGKGYKEKEGLTNHIIFKHRFDEDVQDKYWRK